MYRRETTAQVKMELPFDVALNTESKWVQISKMLPWERIEDEYEKHFHGNEGQVAKSSRLAFGALYIQATEGFTDEKTREHIQENPHMQYFCGMERYTTEPPFDASMMVHFRKRITAEMVKQIIEETFTAEAVSQMDAAGEDERGEDEQGKDGQSEDKQEQKEGGEGSKKRGTLILDATCCPQDIQYPTDIGLLNHARELTEEMIDKMYKAVRTQYAYKPRTYRNVARKEYLSYAKTRKHPGNMIRKQLRKQLQYTARNLRTIQGLVDKGAPLTALNQQLYRKLLVINEVYRQQKEMYDTKTHRCDARIVSLSQPHVRPIVRGKEHTPTEFGAKVAIGLVGGYAFPTCMSWENIPEASVLPEAAEQYKKQFGFYPQKILGDRAYPNKDNRKWCKERGIRLSGPRLGRKNEEMKAAEAKQIYEDSCKRNAVEGVFGVTKRKYGLDCIMAKLPDTSLTAVAMGFFVANMERKLRLLFSPDSLCFVLYDFESLRLVISCAATDEALSFP